MHPSSGSFPRYAERWLSDTAAPYDLWPDETPSSNISYPPLGLFFLAPSSVYPRACVVHRSPRFLSWPAFESALFRGCRANSHQLWRASVAEGTTARVFMCLRCCSVCDGDDSEATRESACLVSDAARRSEAILQPEIREAGYEGSFYALSPLPPFMSVPPWRSWRRRRHERPDHAST